MNILVIPEDFRKDQYILKPLFSRLFRRLGVSNPQVVVCRDPLLGGIDEALRTDRLAEIVNDQQGMTDIFILCVDRDGAVGRRQRLDRIEAEFQGRCVFFAENAWEEVETWALAGLTLPGEWRWADVRAEVQVKERYFEPLAVRRGLVSATEYSRRGLNSEESRRIRQVLGEKAARRVPAIRQKCPEDFDALALRLAAAVQAT